MPGRMVPIPRGGAVLIDALGAVAIEARPSGEPAVLIELGGRLNKTDERWSGQFLFSVGQAAELLANVAVAGNRAGRDFAAELDAALTREQERIGAIEAEHDVAGEPEPERGAVVGDLDLDAAVEAPPEPEPLEDRRPYVGTGADGARRSAQIDREERDTLPAGAERRDELEESARRWEAQAERIERDQRL